VAVPVLVGVFVGVAVNIGVEVNVGMASSPPPPQAGSRISSNKLSTVNTTDHRFM
jgi:hypothetical protein